MKFGLFLFFYAFSLQASSDECVTWFKKSGVKSEGRRCFVECSQVSVGIGTWMCPSRCGEFCHSKQKVHYFFGNGMFNTVQDAAAGAKNLAYVINQSLAAHPDLTAITERPVYVDVAYNSNESLFIQLHQVFTQKVDMEQALFFRWLSNLNFAPHWFRRAAKNISMEATIKDADLEDHMRRYEVALGKGDGIIVVSHSQGNLYSHAAYARLGFTQDFRIIPIASPYCEEMSERLYNGSPYTTLYSDGVIRMVPFSYPPNVANPSPGLFDHAFVQHYLLGKNSGPKILNDLMCMTGVFLMRQRPVYLNSYLWDSEWDHPTCRNMTPHPTAVRDAKREAEEEKE